MGKSCFHNWIWFVMQNTINCNVQSFSKLGMACNFGEPLRKSIAYSWLYKQELVRSYLPFHAYKYSQRVPLQTHIPSPWRSLWECWSPDTCNTPQKRTTETQQEALMSLLSTYSIQSSTIRMANGPGDTVSIMYVCFYTLQNETFGFLWYVTYKLYWFVIVL